MTHEEKLIKSHYKKYKIQQINEWTEIDVNHF